MTRLFATILRAGGKPDTSNDDLRMRVNGFVWSCPVAARVDLVQLVEHGKALLGDMLVGVRSDETRVVLYLSADYPIYDEPTIDG